MKKFVFLFLFITLATVVSAQLKVKATCPDFYVDILDGKINGLKASAMIYDIKNKFPCFTSTEDESNSAKCGGGVYYKDRDVSFYTARDYVEIGPKFKGKLSIPLFGTRRGGLFKTLGNPAMKDANWDAYQTSYGLLILYYDAASKVKLIRFSTQGTGTIQLCE
jgi:hypothetical protein